MLSSRRSWAGLWGRRRGRSSPRRPDSRCAIGLGSNLGDRRAHLVDAVAGLAELGIVLSVSSLWETAPVGPVEQGDYLNAVVVLDSVLGPRPLLDACLGLESAAGRERSEHWGPRTLDVDLLLYGDAVIEAPGLIVPHPRMASRRFVLAPLVEAWPLAEIPGVGPAAELLDVVASQEAERLPDPEWWR